MTATLRAPVHGLPPGPRLPVAVQTVLFGKYRHRYLPAMQRRYGDVFTLRIAPHSRRLVMLSRPDDIRTVFTGQPATFHAGEGNALLGPIMGHHSVLLLDESEHMRVRQPLAPARRTSGRARPSRPVPGPTRQSTATRAGCRRRAAHRAVLARSPPATDPCRLPGSRVLVDHPRWKTMSPPKTDGGSG